jgi:hypothetical protein
MRIPGETIELGDNQGGPVRPTHREGLDQFGAIRPLAGLNLGERRDQAATVAGLGDVAGDRRLLRLDTEDRIGPGARSRRGSRRRKR